MIIQSLLTIPRFRVLSAFFTNLSAAWFLALIIGKEPLPVLTLDFICSIITLLVSFEIEAKITKT